MSVNNNSPVYNFFFHPFAEGHSKLRTFLSIVTIVALTILSAGLYLGILVGVHVYEWWNQIPESSKELLKTASSTIAQVTSKSKETEDEKLQRIIQKHKLQLEQFESWAKNGQWDLFASSHYDWWAFPINRSSMGQGDLYQVDEKQIQKLKNNPVFMQDFRRGVVLVLNSWGWDAENSKELENKMPGQVWKGYCIRLAKMATALELYEVHDLFASAKAFALKKILEENIFDSERDLVLKNLKIIGSL